MKSKLNNNPDITIDANNPDNVQQANTNFEFFSVFKVTNSNIQQAWKISFSISFIGKIGVDWQFNTTVTKLEFQRYQFHRTRFKIYIF